MKSEERNYGCRFQEISIYGYQALILEKMDPATRTLMNRIRDLMDPHGIMNPGNWEGGADAV